MENKFVKLFIAFIITILLAGFLLSQITINQILNIIFNINPTYLLLALFFYIISYIIRAFRIRYLIKKKVSIFELFNIVSIHTMVNGIIPFRVGELSFVYLISKKGIKKTQVVADLLIIRIFDFIIIILLLIVCLLFVGFENIIYLISGIVALLSIILLIIILINSHFFLNFIKKTFVIKFSFVKYVVEKIEEITNYFKKIKSIKTIYSILIYSLFVWIAKFSMGYVLLLQMGIDIGLLKTIMAFSISTFTTSLPIHGLLGFGTSEAGWVIAFMFFGISLELAISSGFSFHIINIVYFTILGIIALFNHRKKII